MDQAKSHRSTPKDSTTTAQKTTKQSVLANAGQKNIFDTMVQEFAHNAHINRGDNMNLHVHVRSICVTDSSFFLSVGGFRRQF